MPKTAAPPVEFDHEYNVPCPECAHAGNPGVPIGFAMSEGICCATGGHHFDRVPGEGQNPSEATAAAPGDKSDAKVTISGLEPLQKAIGNPEAGTTEAQIKQRESERLQDERRERALKGELGAVVRTEQRMQDAIDGKPVPGKIGPTYGQVVKPNHTKPVQVLDATPAPGGEITLTVVLRERHASAVLAECGVQGQSATEYFQEFLDRMLDAYWGQV